MKINKYLLVCLIVGWGLESVYFSDLYGAAPSVVSRETKLIDRANRLPKQGQLLDNGDGFVYVKVDDRYIFDLFPFIDKQEKFRQPDYFRRPDAAGAHISVFYKNETSHLGKIKEIGQPFSFKIVTIENAYANGKEYKVIVVDAFELEKLRASYGLSPFLQGHPFHITIGQKRLHK